MKSNEQLQKDVEDAIKWEPLLKMAEITVSASDGVIHLTGTTDSYAKRLEAKGAAKNVVGVTAVVEKIQVKVDSAGKRDDNDIAAEVVNALKGRWEALPHEKVRITVEDGLVTLEGETKWNYQREVAVKAAADPIGVRGVINNITLRTNIQDTVQKADVERALARNWAIGGKGIAVEVRLNKVTLTGVVSSIYQKEEAGRIAWAAPGISAMDNELVVGYDI